MEEMQVMKYKNIYLIFTSCMLLFLMNLAPAFAITSKESPDEAIKRDFPKLKYRSIEKTDIDGLYEVNTGERILYFYPKRGYVLIGEIFTKDGRNLTRESIEEEKYKLLTSEDFKKGIKIGSGKNIVVEVTDPECPFCRKMHAYWSMRSDVTRYVFFKPLDIHPDARKMATYILVASDPVKAMFEVYCGSLDNKKDVLNKVFDEKGRLENQKAVVDKLQVTGTPSYWVNGRFVSGANVSLIESIIGKTGNAIPNIHDDAQSNCGG
jgi:thiol:disulfide interchange protein DsbC